MEKIKYYLIIPLFLVLIVFTSCSKKEEGNQNTQTAVKNNEYWTCTMHPQIIRDRPGVCPICGMELVKRTQNVQQDTSKNIKDIEGMISLSEGKQILANVSTVKVVKENLPEELTVYSYLDFAEQNRKTISARFNGRLEKLFVNKTGSYIKKGDPLFEVYSPDLVQAENEYILALKNPDKTNSLLDASKKKLEILGLTPEQIKDLETSKEVKLTFTYYSPVNGTVIEKKVQEGMYINEGTAIYDVADLSSIWDIAEVPENNLSSIKTGNIVKLHLKAYPGDVFTGKVTLIYPVVNPQTRTVKIRSEFQNYNNKLKPQMYGETVFSTDGGENLFIPASAVLFTGKRNVVWVKTGDNMFEVRNVQVGDKSGDKYRVLSGLSEGEEVAATGGFLIDSESQLTGGASTGHEGMQMQTQTKNDNMNMNKNKSVGNIVRKGTIDLEKIDKNKDGKVFQDMMHWNVISDKPGKCPLCGMTLQKVTLHDAKENLIKNGFKVK